jgi:peroxiredoxin
MHLDARNMVILVVLPLLLASCKTQDAGKIAKTEEPTQKVELGEIVPDFALKDHEGAMIRLSDFRGKIVVLEWINLECPFVQRHYREETFKNTAGKYNQKQVAWIAINSTHWAKASSNKQWHDKYQLPYPILDDSAGRVGRLFAAKTTPHMFIINKDGRLVYSGGIDDDASGSLGEKRIPYVRQALDDLIAGNLPKTQQTKPYG